MHSESPAADSEVRATVASPRRQIAAFDFDGTITQRDTLLGFLALAGGSAKTAAALAQQSIGLTRGLVDDEARDRAKERVLGQVLAGSTRQQLEGAGRNYAAELRQRCREDAVERIRWHHDQGHELVIVSASLVYYLEPFADRLGFDGVIAVELEFDEADIATGRFSRSNVRAAQKAERLREWIAATGGGEVELWAYGNSAGDDELIEMADHPLWMGKRSNRNPVTS